MDFMSFNSDTSSSSVQADLKKKTNKKILSMSVKSVLFLQPFRQLIRVFFLKVCF